MMSCNSLYSHRRLETRGYHSHNLRFSPFEEKLIAVVGAENFGIQGSGSLILFDILAELPIIKKFSYNDALFDVCWTKANPDFALTSSGDGCVQLWSITNPYHTPMANRKFHTKEVSTIDCSVSSPHHLVMGSWDGVITLCEINSFRPVSVLKQENTLIYEVRWSNIHERDMASVSGDGRAFVWSPFTSSKPSISFTSVNTELLSCDWSHNTPYLLITAGSNALILGWDIRFPTTPLFQLTGHDNAIKKIRFSPFITTEVISVSYDFTTRLWDITSPVECSRVKTHTEFVYGLDYSLLLPGIVADCAFDQSVQLYKIGPSPPICLQPSGPFSILSTPREFPPSHLPPMLCRPLPPLPPPAAHVQAYTPPLPPPISYRPHTPNELKSSSSHLGDLQRSLMLQAVGPSPSAISTPEASSMIPLSTTIGPWTITPLTSNSETDE